MLTIAFDLTQGVELQSKAENIQNTTDCKLQAVEKEQQRQQLCVNQVAALAHIGVALYSCCFLLQLCYR